MNKQNLALSILVICLASLILGMFIPFKKQDIPQNINIDTSFVDTAGDKIALLNIDGPITADNPNSPWSSEFSSNGFIESLEKAKLDRKVKAIIIRINSPGGTVAASQDIYDAVLRAREAKPIIVSMADVCASGGYYIASAADRIIAQKGTLTGSIGVIMNFVDIAKLADKWGINSNVIKSGKFKDSGSMYRSMTADEKNLFQDSINTSYNQFIDAIKVGRIDRNDKYDCPKTDLSIDILKTYADGRAILGSDAYKYGFVDGLGSMYEATACAANMAGNPSLPVVPYNKLTGWKSIFRSMESKLSQSLKETLPFSYTHNSQPLMIME